MAQAPAQFDMKDAVPLTAAAPAQFDMSDAVPLQDFTSNENNEGTYEMAGPGGKKVKIPYGMISTASQAGYKMTDTDRGRYVKDSAADPNLNQDKNLPEGVKVTGKNSAGQDILASEGTAPGSAVSRWVSTQSSNLGGAIKGFGKFLDPRPSEEEKQRGQTSTFDILMRYPERMIQPNVDMEQQAKQEREAGNYSSSAEHSIASAIPVVGPFAANVIDSTGEHLARGDYAGAGSNVVSNAMIAEAPGVVGEVVKGAVSAIPKSASSLVRSVTKTSPREVQDLAEHTEKENIAAAKTAEDINAKRAEKHLGDALDAVQEANKHANKQMFLSDEVKRENEANRLEHNQKELNRVKDEGQKRLDALKKNKEQIDNNAKLRRDSPSYEDQREAIRKENETNYRRQIAQHNLESKLKEATDEMDTQFVKAADSAKGKYNSTWKVWRDQMKNAKADMTPTVDVIKDQEKSIGDPAKVVQFREILNETAPDSGNLNAQDEIEKFSRDNFGKAYADLDDQQLAAIDAYKDAMGINLTSASLKDIPAERLHTWKSQLERAVRTTKDGTIRSAIGKVLQQVRQQETALSASVGPKAVAALLKARAITGPYFDAFFKEEPELPPVAAKSLREQNPAQAKEKGAEARLINIARYNPELAPAAKRVASLSENLEKLRKKREIGKRSELPIPPKATTMTDKGPVLNRNHPSIPSRPSPAVPFQPKEFTPTPGGENTVVPDKPLTEEAAKKTLSVEDYQKWKAENVKKTAQHIRDLSISRAMYSGMTALPLSIASFAMGHPGAAVLELSIPGAAIAFPNAVATLLDKPGVVEYLSRVNSKDVAAFEKLPPEQKAIFKDDMRALTKEAKKQGAIISPVFSAFLKTGTIAGASSEMQRKKKPTPKELLDEAHRNLQSQFQQQGLAPQ